MHNAGGIEQLNFKVAQTTGWSGTSMSSSCIAWSPMDLRCFDCETPQQTWRKKNVKPCGCRHPRARENAHAESLNTCFKSWYSLTNDWYQCYFGPESWSYPCIPSMNVRWCQCTKSFGYRIPGVLDWWNSTVSFDQNEMSCSKKKSNMP